MNVFVAVLDWGLGHASRSVQLIRILKELDFQVIAGTSGAARYLLEREIPGLTIIDLPPYHPVYGSNRVTVVSMLLQMPKFLRAIRMEHDLLQNIIQSHNINLVISDNRYGCWSERTPSIMLTHQLRIIMPSHLRWLSGIVNRVNRHFIKKFSCCWIPDVKSGVTGKMTKDAGVEGTYIGYLSRFEKSSGDRISDSHEVVVVLSGPEPLRTRFEKKLVAQLGQSGKKALLVRGVPGDHTHQVGNLTITDFLNAETLISTLRHSDTVIARCGYSTIMDFAALGLGAVLVPTPGQPEQEYLAQQLMMHGHAYCPAENEFDLHTAIARSREFKPVPASFMASRNAIADALKSVPGFTFAVH